ncbi:MAG: four helix bundle protein [bacterium]|nr:four helix bundle protein [bacterium]
MTTNYAQSRYKTNFTPRKPVKTFRDLDIYQKTMECAVIVVKNIRPKLVTLKYPFLEGITDCAMSVPLFIGEAHSIRFGNFALGLQLIEKAMSGCNKMIIYLEHIKGMYGAKMDGDVLDEIIARYAESRTKTFHLEQSWKKWHTAPREPNAPKVRL